MEKEIFEILTRVQNGEQSVGDAQSQLLLLFSVSRCGTEPKLVKCDNCGEMVQMISSGEFCPCCFC